MNWISYVSLLSPCFAFFIALSRRESIDVTSGIILLFLIASFASDILSYLWAINFGSNYWIIKIYQILEFGLVWMYFGMVLKQPRSKYVLILVVPFLVLISLDKINDINVLTQGIVCLLFTFLGVLDFIKAFNDSEHEILDKVPEFWFTSGILFYFSGSLFSWVMFNYLQVEASSEFWTFHNIANILKNILFAIGLWKVRAAV
jgi:hypothetical protein